LTPGVGKAGGRNRVSGPLGGSVIDDRSVLDVSCRRAIAGTAASDRISRIDSFRSIGSIAKNATQATNAKFTPISRKTNVREKGRDMAKAFWGRMS